MTRAFAWIWLIAAALVPSSARSLSLIVDRLDTPDVVEAGDAVSFSFAFGLAPDEALLHTQLELSIPLLTGFSFPSTSGITTANPWDLISTFKLNYLGNPMWVHVENAFGEDPPGVTWDEVGGVVPLGRFSAVATYNGEIELTPLIWIVGRFTGFGQNGTAEWADIPMDPVYEHIHTGVTIVGGLDLPPPAPMPPPAPDPPPSPPPSGDSQGGRDVPANSGLPEPPSGALASLAVLLIALRRSRAR